MPRRRAVLAAALLFACLPTPPTVRAGQEDRSPPADSIFVNGQIWTGDPRKPRAQAIAVRGTRIVRLGSDRQIEALAGRGSVRVDLRGRFVFPGFID